MDAYVYILASKKHVTRNLGVTRDIIRRVTNFAPMPSAASRRAMASTSLSWFEIYNDIGTAIAREKELKIMEVVIGRFD